MRRIAILDAPSNLGLRPPTATSVPGCAKAPGALRDHGLIDRLHARDAGCLTPPRYDPGDWRPGDGVSHAGEIATYSRKLADRIGAIIDAGEFPLVLGGDCSIVLGSGLAMHRLGEAVGGRIGLVFVDGHSDFRHPGNASYVGAAAGEDLALVTGRGQTDLAAMEGRRPYFRDVDVVVMGIRAQDEYRLDLQAAGIVTRPVPTLRVEGAARSAQWARDQLVDCAGYWVHVDMDVLDPAVMPAVDAPEPGGIAFPELELLLAGLVDTPHCLGVEITVFDPDYDPDGAYAEEIASTIVAGLAPVRTVATRPDLIAARRDLAARTDLPGADGREAERFGPGRRAAGGLGLPGLGGSASDTPAPGGLGPAGLRPAGLGPAGLGPAGLGPGGLGPAGLGPGGLRPGGLRSGGLGLGGPGPGGQEPGGQGPGGLGPGGLGPGGLGPGRLGAAAMAADDDDEPDPVAARRAAAAADSVTLAAAGMSGGGSAGPDEAAAPATTLLGVEEAGEVESHPAGEAQAERLDDDETDLADESDDDIADDVKDDVGDRESAFAEQADDDGAVAGDGGIDEPVDHWSGDDANDGTDLEDHQPDVEDQKSGFGDQGPDVEDREPGFGDQGPDVEDREPGFGDQEPALEDHEPARDDHELARELHGRPFEDHELASDGRLRVAADHDGAPDHDRAADHDGATDHDRAAVRDGGADHEGAADEGETAAEEEDRDAVEDDDADEPRPPFVRADGIPVQPVSRPLGSAPLLDSQPLPATRPGMLRPRTADGFSLPAQRPAFDAGSPADIA